jgi:LPXTG-motif cell wall-anchored protein
VAKAINDYNAVVELAKTGSEGGTTEDITAAAAKITTAINNAKSATDNATAAITDAGEVKNETAVADALTALQTLTANPNSSTADINKAITDLNTAVGDAKPLREDAKTDGAAVVAQATTDGVADNAEVAKAINDYNAVVELAKTGSEGGTTADITAAAAKITTAITAATTANATLQEALNNTAPVSNESAVTAALTKLTAISDNPATSTAALNNAVAEFNQVVQTAKQDRLAAIADGNVLVKTAQNTGLAAGTEVAKAIADFNAVVAEANTEKATTVDVEKAADALRTAINAGLDARDAAGKIVTSPYSEEPAVSAANTALQTLLADPASSTADIVAATATLQQAVNAAATKREDTVDEGVKVTKSAEALALSKRADVALAIGIYRDAVARAADDADVTKTIQKAIDDLKAALAKIQKAIDDAKTATTAEVAQEPAVTAAQAELDKILAPDSTATAAEIEAATDKLNGVVESATTERETVTAPADRTVIDSGKSGISANDEVGAAIKQYEDAKANAATGTPDAVTTAAIKDAADKLQDVITKLDDAIDNAKNVATGPVAKDATVDAAQAVVDKLLADPSSSAADLNKASADLEKAVTDAKTERAQVVETGDQTQEQIKDNNFRSNPDVAAVLQDYLNVQKQAEGNNASTADMQDALTDLQKVVTELTGAITDAKSVVSAPVAKDAAVNGAQKVLDDVLADPSSTAATIKKATEDLRTAIDQAQTERKRVVDTANDVQTTIKDNNFGSNPDVAAALQDYLNVQNQAEGNNASTADMQDALTNLQKVVTELAGVITNAKNVDGAPVAKDASVDDAQKALDDVLANPSSTAEEITQATDNLRQVIDQAKTERAQVEAAGDALQTTIAQSKYDANPEIAAALQDYLEVQKRAQGNGASTADEKAALTELQKIVDDLNTARDTAEGVQTGAYARDAAVAAAEAKLQDLLSQPGSTASAIRAATTALQNALQAAATERANAIKQGDHLAKQLQNVAGGQQLITKYQQLKLHAADGQASTADLQAVIAEMMSGLAAAGHGQLPATGGSVNANRGEQTTGIQSGDIQSGKVELPQTGDADNRQASVAGVLGLAATTMFALLGLGKKRKEDEE